MSPELTTDEQDQQHEQTALREVLAIQPNTLTESELIQLLGADLSDRIDSERWQIAIRELCRSGLLRVEGGRVYPTQAALAFFDFMETWV